MKIAISGAGVAGPSLAHWLHRTGHEPTLIERAPHFRTGGYVIDFWGVGYHVAHLMGIEAAVRDASYQVQSIRSVGPDGRVGASLGVEAFRRAAGGKLTSLPRGDWPPPSTPRLSTTSKRSSVIPLPRSTNTPTA